MSPKIWLVFYTKAEDDEELFLSAHATRQGAAQAAQEDAADNFGEGFTWGDGQHHADLPKGFTRSTDILTDWSKVDDYEAGSYTLYEVDLHGAAEIRVTAAAAMGERARLDASVCQHLMFEYINRRNLNWRCLDECGYQFLGKTVTQARREARAARREVAEDSRAKEGSGGEATV